MDFQLSLLDQSFSLIPPQSVTAWGLVFLYLAFIVWRIMYWGKSSRAIKRVNPIIVTLLVILLPFFSLFFIIRLDISGSSTILPLNGEPDIVYIAFLSVLPWMLAGGLLPPVYSILGSIVSGILLSGFTWHSWLLPLEMGVSAVAFCELIRMRVKKQFPRLLHHPLGAGLISAILVIALDLVASSIGEQAICFSAGLGTAIGWGKYFAFSLPFLIAGIAAMVISQLFDFSWVKPVAVEPKIKEQGMPQRFMKKTGTLVILFFSLLLAATWIIATVVARNALESYLAEVASTVADHYSGQISSWVADVEELQPLEGDHIDGQLSQIYSDLRERSIPVHRILFSNANGEWSIHPKEDKAVIPEVLLANQGHGQGSRLLLGYSSTADLPDLYIRILRDTGAGGGTSGWLFIQVDWAGAAQIHTAKETQNELHAKGIRLILLDDSNTVIYQQDQSLIGTQLDLSKSMLPELTVSEPLNISGWQVVSSVPLARVQSEAWKIALPLSVAILIVAFLVYFILSSNIQSMTRSLRALTEEVERMAKGSMDQPQSVHGEDEIGQLGNTLEEMRVKLKGSIDQQTLLLNVSQGISAHLDLETALHPILEAALTHGGGMARVTLLPDPNQETGFEKMQSFSLGEMEKYYSYLDEEVLAVTRSRDYVTMNNLQRGRGLRLDPQKLNPSALISLPILQGNRLLGILWVAYDSPRKFSEGEIRFLSVLATDCALVVNNIRLYKSAELGKKRLLAILRSTPDPILLLDDQGRIVLANNPARMLAAEFELIPEGRLLIEVFSSPDLHELLKLENGSGEVHFSSGRTYHVNLASLQVDGMNLGRACLMRDVTNYKEVDSRRSEFVANVSHDLRSPLVLMRGNSMMIQNMGQLNEQQKTYLSRMQTGIDGMLHLVNNLLNLDRIESGAGSEMTRISIVDLIHKVRDDLELQRVNKGIQWVEERMDPSSYVTGDETLLYQAIYNLLENAIKFSNMSSEVILSCSIENPGEVMIGVSDHGKGIAPLDIPKIFESSYRSQQREGFTQRQLAMGLHIVKKIADRHGGRVWVSSQLGRGSSFFLAIPAELTEGGE